MKDPDQKKPRLRPPIHGEVQLLYIFIKTAGEGRSHVGPAAIQMAWGGCVTVSGSLTPSPSPSKIGAVCNKNSKGLARTKYTDSKYTTGMGTGVFRSVGLRPFTIPQEDQGIAHGHTVSYGHKFYRCVLHAYDYT